MKSISFKINEEEIKRLSELKLEKDEIKKVLSIVENDLVLWENIEQSIKEAVRIVVEKRNIK